MMPACKYGMNNCPLIQKTKNKLKRNTKNTINKKRNQVNTLSISNKKIEKPPKNLESKLELNNNYWKKPVLNLSISKIN